MAGGKISSSLAGGGMKKKRLPGKELQFPPFSLSPSGERVRVRGKILAAPIRLTTAINRS
jgi:hypothetical protein